MNKIIHGDCLIELKKLQNNSVDLLLTDPPYGNNTVYYGGRTIAGDEHPLIGLLAVAECYRILKRNSTAYVFLDIKHLPITRTFIDSYTRFSIREWLVWDKKWFGMGRAFRKQHEIIMVLEKGRPKYRRENVGNVLSVKRTINNEHPHKKPVDLLIKLIEHSTDPGDIVLDPFIGSGSTAVAAALCKRRCIGVERDDQFVKLTRSRLASTDHPRVQGEVQ